MIVLSLSAHNTSTELFDKNGGMKWNAISHICGEKTLSQSLKLRIYCDFAALCVLYTQKTKQNKGTGMNSEEEEEKRTNE